jgi:hypothetical protein
LSPTARIVIDYIYRKNTAKFFGIADLYASAAAGPVVAHRISVADVTGSVRRNSAAIPLSDRINYFSFFDDLDAKAIPLLPFPPAPTRG